MTDETETKTENTFSVLQEEDTEPLLEEDDEFWLLINKL